MQQPLLSTVAGMHAHSHNPRTRTHACAPRRPWITEKGLPETRDAMWSAFINRVRDNLHIVLAMSPGGWCARCACACTSSCGHEPKWVAVLVVVPKVSPFCLGIDYTV